MTRTLKRWICRTLMATMLFAQLAAAAHACPGLSSVPGQALPTPAAEAAAGTAMAMATDEVAADSAHAPPGMADCEHMAAAASDKASPNLCAQHCRQGQQSDQASTVTVPLVCLTSLYTLAPLSTTMPAPAAPGVQPGVLVAASPPHSILHCCLRD